MDREDITRLWTPPFFRLFYLRRLAGPGYFEVAARPGDIPESAQWKTHEVTNAETTESSDVMHRHFMAINSDWKRSRTGARQIDAGVHRTDEALVDAMNQALDLSTLEVDGFSAGDGPLTVVPHRTLAAVSMMLEQSCHLFASNKDLVLLFALPSPGHGMERT